MGNNNDKLPFRIKKGDTTFEKIMAHHIDPLRFELSPKLEEIRLRWAEVLTLLLNRNSPQQVVNKLIEDHGLSPAQAYLDVKNAQQLYGNVMESDNKGRRAILYEYSHQYFERAILKGDLKAQDRALQLMARFGGLDDVSSADFNPEKLENVEIKFAVNKAYFKYLKIVNASPGVDDLNLSEPIDVEFEEIENNDEPE